MSARNSSLYVYEIPYLIRKDFCRLLDLNDEWKDLGGHMEYRTFDILEIENECRRRSSSPTDLLLTKWGQQNHTVLELFVLLSRMKHHPAMNCLRTIVDSRYHCLIDQACTSIDSYRKNAKSTQSEVYSTDNNNTSNVPLPVQYIEQGVVIKNSTKILNGPPPNINPAVESSSNPVAESVGGLLMIPYGELTSATKYWHHENVLGKGGFGVVFKGDWKNTEVAIKRLKSSDGKVSDETLRELRYLNGCRHDHVLPLYGYSVDGKEPCLVYQLMSGGSLEDRLRCRGSHSPLSWCQRLLIAQGVAKGLQFLHTVSKSPLIHGDIKSANILLDANDSPKIGDFGLARIGPNSDELTHMNVSRVHGTRPYLPDEFLRFHRLSAKVDTYSFGVVLFEIVSGLSAYDTRRKYPYLKDHVVEYCKLHHTDMDGLQDARLTRIGESDPFTSMRITTVGIKCVQDRAGDRPHMVDTWQELMGIPSPELTR